MSSKMKAAYVDQMYKKAECKRNSLRVEKEVNMVKHAVSSNPEKPEIEGEFSVGRSGKFSDWVYERSCKIYVIATDQRGDVPGWVLVVLMTTGLVTGIWTLAAPRIDQILRSSLDSMNSIR